MYQRITNLQKRRNSISSDSAMHLGNLLELACCGEYRRRRKDPLAPPLREIRSANVENDFYAAFGARSCFAPREHLYVGKNGLRRTYHERQAMERLSFSASSGLHQTLWKHFQLTEFQKFKLSHRKRCGTMYFQKIIPRTCIHEELRSNDWSTTSYGGMDHRGSHTRFRDRKLWKYRIQCYEDWIQNGQNDAGRQRRHQASSRSSLPIVNWREWSRTAFAGEMRNKIIRRIALWQSSS